MQDAQNGYRVEFSAISCTQVTKVEYFTAPDGGEYSLIFTGLSEVIEDLFSYIMYIFIKVLGNPHCSK